jgi:hypothetical protein
VEPFVPEKQRREWLTFHTKLLRKRAGYEKYFAKGLVAVDAALRRVACFRGFHGTRVVDETIGPRVSSRESKERGIFPTGERKPILVSPQEDVDAMKAAIRGVVGKKEKTALKKYSLRCVERRSRGQRRRDKRLLDWELRQKKIEKAERDWNWKVRSEAVEQFYALGGRQPGRGESLIAIPILPMGFSNRAINYVVAGPTRKTVASTPPYYFDPSGNRVTTARDRRGALSSSLNLVRGPFQTIAHRAASIKKV